MRFFGRKKEKEEKREEREEQFPQEISIEELMKGLDEFLRELSMKKKEAGKGEEVKKVEPKSEEEILLEILKELKELNSNVKALIIRADIGREEMRQIAEDFYVRLKQKLDNMTMGIG